MTALSEELAAMGGQWRFQHTVITMPVGFAPTLLVAANPLRWGIVFSYFADPAHPTGGMVIGVDSSIENGFGIALWPQSVLRFNFRQWGSFVGQNWFGSGVAVGTPNVDIWEVIAQQ